MLKILINEICPDALELLIDSLSNKYSLERPDQIFSLDILQKIQNRTVFSHLNQGFKKNMLVISKILIKLLIFPFEKLGESRHRIKY